MAVQNGFETIPPAGMKPRKVSEGRMEPVLRPSYLGVVGIYIRIAPIVTLMLIRYLDGDLLMSLAPVSTFKNHP